MFAVFNWGPIVGSGGYSEIMSGALNKWEKENPGIQIEGDPKLVSVPADGNRNRQFVTVLIRYSPAPVPSTVTQL